MKLAIVAWHGAHIQPDFCFLETQMKLIVLTAFFWLWTEHNFVPFIISRNLSAWSYAFQFGRKLKFSNLSVTKHHNQKVQRIISVRFISCHDNWSPNFNTIYQIQVNISNNASNHLCKQLNKIKSTFPMKIEEIKILY